MLRPPKERTASRKYGDHTNSAVNAARVLTIEKSRMAYYPDNGGIPTIRFWFGGKDDHHWYFDHGEEERRDQCYRDTMAALH